MQSFPSVYCTNKGCEFSKIYPGEMLPNAQCQYPRCDKKVSHIRIVRQLDANPVSLTCGYNSTISAVVMPTKLHCNNLCHRKVILKTVRVPISLKLIRVRFHWKRKRISSRSPLIPFWSLTFFSWRHRVSKVPQREWISSTPPQH